MPPITHDDYRDISSILIKGFFAAVISSAESVSSGVRSRMQRYSFSIVLSFI